MKKSVLILVCCVAFPAQNFAAGFYTDIDEWSFTLRNQLVDTRLKEYKSMDSFWKECDRDWLLTRDMPFDRSVLEDSYQLSSKIKKDTSTDALLETFHCLSRKYRAVVAESSADAEKMQKLASIGLYTDGDTSNSDYDIVSDIARINNIVFESPTPYAGTKNIWKTSIAKLVSGKWVDWNDDFKKIFAEADQASGSQGSTNTSGQNTSWVLDSSTSMNQTNEIACLIPSEHRLPSGLVNEDFAREIGASVGTNYADQINTQTNNTSSQNGSNSSAATKQNANSENSKSDFFPKLPCTGVFCIRVGASLSSQNALNWWAKDTTIESLFRKHLQIITPIAESPLAYSEMPIQMGQSAFSSLNFLSVLRRDMIRIVDAPQIAKKDKKDVTPESIKDEFDAMQACSTSENGLKQNGFVGNGFAFRTSSSTVGSASDEITPFEPQSFESLRGCIGEYSQGISLAYQASLGQDLVHIQTYTASMTTLINEIIDVTLVKLKNTPTR